MSKRVISIILVSIFLLSLLASCAGSRETCPAYPSHYKKERLPY
ncbi:MAG: hypothetical protein RSC04_05520 [Bacteroidales bacterium]